MKPARKMSLLRSSGKYFFGRVSTNMPPLRGSVAGIVPTSSGAFETSQAWDEGRCHSLARIEGARVGRWFRRGASQFCGAAADDVTPTGFVSFFVRFLQICHPYGVQVPAEYGCPAALSKSEDRTTSCGQRVCPSPHGSDAIAPKLKAKAEKPAAQRTWKSALRLNGPTAASKA
jgi:hypothetical protein